MSVPSGAIDSYVPKLVLRALAHGAPDACSSSRNAEQVMGAVLLSDISGFTPLAERLALRGAAGAEELSEHLNGYFGRLIALITEHGGDVLKLAGDSLLALWPAGDEPLSTAALRAAHCALSMQATTAKHTEVEGIRLMSKVGIGTGEIAVLHVGGVLGRWELLISGEPLVQCGLAEQNARAGEVVLSSQAWALVSHACKGATIKGDHVLLESIASPPQVRSDPCPPVPPETALSLRNFIPGAILNRIDAGLNDWLAELRPVTVVFINLPHFDVASIEGQQRAAASFQRAPDDAVPS